MWTWADIWSSFVRNWELWSAIGVLIFVLAISGRLTQVFRDARKGLANLLTIDGLVVFGIVAFIAYQIYLAIRGMI